MNFLGMFILFVLAWLSAVVLFFQQPEFPPLWFGVAGLLLSALLVLGGILWGLLKMPSFKIWVFAYITPGYQRLLQRIMLGLYNVFLGFIIGGTWVFWQSFFQPNVADEYLNQTVLIEGQVVALPEGSMSTGFGQEKRRIKMELALKSLQTLSKTLTPSQAWWGLQPRVVVNWYQSPAEVAQFGMPKLGETWRFKVKLSANHASLNPAGLDYERWLFTEYISAKGYVVAQANPAALDHYAVRLMHGGWRGWRGRMAEHFNAVLAPSRYHGVYRALLYGDKSAMRDDDWRLLQTTGTIHLMAISGLHMGLVALLGALFAKGAWWLGLYRWTAVDKPMLIVASAVLFATVYLAVSGAAIPTQRAWIMVVALLAFLLLQRRFQPWQALALAALLVMMWDPRAVLSYGFWLSFGAVVLIFVSLTRPGQRQLDPNTASALRAKALRWLKGVVGFLKIQTVLTLGLAPALIWAFSTVPLYSFIANLVAVPLVTLVGLPALFAIALVSFVSVEWAQFWLTQLDVVWHALWWFLAFLANLPHSNWSNGALSFAGLVGLYGLILWGIWVKKPALKWAAFVSFGVVLCAFLSVPHTARPAFGQAWVTVLDVGQAQAVVIETQRHVMVVDTGAKWGDIMDGAKMAIVPYLRAQNWSTLDTLMVSHSDLDHAGGVQTLLDSVPIKRLISGQADVLNAKHFADTHRQTPLDKPSRFSACLSDQAWSVDGVTFSVLSPTPSDALAKRSDNDLSCVLKVGQGSHSVLIVGDLSTAGEKRLLAQAVQSPSQWSALHAGWLIAGHHGSQHSSSSAWLEAVNPHTVVFSAGYLNRFNFPNVQTVERLHRRDIRWFNTACSGAVRFELGELGVQESRKTQRKWYHHACLETQKGVLFE